MLNIAGNLDSNLRGRACNIMRTNSVGQDQDFVISRKAGYSGYYMLTAQNTNYAVNRSDTDGRAIIWPLSSGHNDSQLYDNSQTVIRLERTRELLTAREPVGDWSKVYWGGSGISVWIRL